MAWTRKTGSGNVAGCWRDPEGVEHSKSFKAGEEQRALKYAQRKELEIERGEYTDPKSGRVTLQRLYDALHTTRAYAPATLAVHEVAWSKLGEPLKRRQVKYISSADIDATLSRIAKPAMREKTRLLLSTLFNHAIAMEPPQLRDNPARLRARPTTRTERKERGRSEATDKRYLSDDELARLLAALPDRHRTLVRLMARVGLRPDRVGKFDPMRRKLTIDTAVSGDTKTGEVRTVTLPAVISQELVEYLERYGDPRNPAALMFPSFEGAMFTVSGFRHTFQRAATAAGLRDRIRPNDLRHTGVSWAIKLGANVYDVQRMVGHPKPSITLDVYGELWDDGQDKLAERMDAALREDSGRINDAEVVTLR
jgi:site-specific recombinase XerD